MASTVQGIKFTFRNPATDKPLSFGKVYTYESGTSSPKVTYSDEGKLAQNTNPVILDANGQANICLEGRYKIIVKDSLDVTIDTVDPISDAATQAKDFVGSIYGFGTSAIKNVGENYGDVMMIGDGSWLGKAKLWPDPLFPAINDMNSIPNTMKLYYGSALVNAPTANKIRFINIPLSDGTIMQEAIDLTTFIEYRRTYASPTWSAWAVSYNDNVIVKKDSDTGVVYLASGTTAQRPTLGNGIKGIRYNTTLSSFEGGIGTAGATTWGSLGGGATGGGTDHAFMENDQVITADYTLTAGKNAISAGPISINTGVTVTVPTGATWTIV